MAFLFLFFFSFFIRISLFYFLSGGFACFGKKKKKIQCFYDSSASLFAANSFCAFGLSRCHHMQSAQRAIFGVPIKVLFSKIRIKLHRYLQIQDIEVFRRNLSLMPELSFESRLLSGQTAAQYCGLSLREPVLSCL